MLRPSQDLGKLAADEYGRFPAMLRYLLRGIGATGSAGEDLLSYLAFEPIYVQRAMDLGYADTVAAAPRWRSSSRRRRAASGTGARRAEPRPDRRGARRGEPTAAPNRRRMAVASGAALIYSRASIEGGAGRLRTRP